MLWSPRPSITYRLEIEKDFKLNCINPNVLYGTGRQRGGGYFGFQRSHPTNGADRHGIRKVCHKIWEVRTMVETIVAFSGIPKQMGTKSELATSPLHSRGGKNGWKCYVTLAFSGIPKRMGTKSELAASPLLSRVPKRGRKCYVTPALLGVPKQRRTKSESAASTLSCRGPKRGPKCYVTPALLGVLYKGGQNQNWLPHP